MAISTQRTLAQLKRETDELGLTVVPSGKRISKTDYILKLREYYIGVNYPNGLPKPLELILNIESPMLCQRYTILNEAEQENIWEGKNWILEQKEDGARMNMVFVDKGWDFFSRNISVGDFLPISYKDNVWLDYMDFSKIEDEFILDAEIVSSNSNICNEMSKTGVTTETQLQACTALLAMNSEDSIRIQKEGSPFEFRIFDIIWFNGEWLLDKPLIERLDYLKKVLTQLEKAGMRARKPYSNYSNKRAFYKAMIAAGNEGAVAKNLLSPYIATNSRRRDGWIKIKRSMSETSQLLGLGDTIDAFISGYEPADKEKSWAGLVGAIEFSVHLRDEDGQTKAHKIARITNIPMELREEMTELNDEGEPILKSEWYGKVGSIDGQCVSAREKRLKHAVLVDWRPDRSEDTCIMDVDFLESMIL